MVQNVIRGVICHAIPWYVKANNKYIKDYDLPFLAERTKIEKAEKLEDKLHDKKEYVIHTINLKQALNHGLVLKKRVESLNWIKQFG